MFFITFDDIGQEFGPIGPFLDVLSSSLVYDEAYTADLFISSMFSRIAVSVQHLKMIY